jgi:prevent-host-death family protein
MVFLQEQTMAEKVMSVSRAKTHFLALAEEVAATGQDVLVTKRGRPLVRVTPVEPAPPLTGSVTFNVDEEELIYSPLEEWDVDRG